MKNLNPNSVSYLFNFLQYYDWVRFKGYWKSAQEMIDEHEKLLDSPDRKKRLRHRATQNTTLIFGLGAILSS
jgi:hypothetical protein